MCLTHCVTFETEGRCVTALLPSEAAEKGEVFPQSAAKQAHNTCLSTGGEASIV